MVDGGSKWSSTDDMIIVGNDPFQCQKFKQFLHGQFHLKDLGPFKFFLGLEVARNPEGIFLSQRKYALDILTDTGLSGAKPSPFPMSQQHQLGHSTSTPLADPSSYRCLVGRLLYLTITRPDILYVVNILSQYMHSPRLDHHDAAMKVVRYIKNSPGQGLFFPSQNNLQLTGYCDAD
ncbi:uncharacterized mitochondrial protein AtMg00810-like [Coffea arabica]|uniref:Uncharacterized mitochondrial protein AtMg00810-like n=1 Tax=Coffea arabica TaxID=13443 RepID=A0ABM4WPK9_COFAR